LETGMGRLYFCDVHGRDLFLVLAREFGYKPGALWYNGELTKKGRR